MDEKNAPVRGDQPYALETAPFRDLSARMAAALAELMLCGGLRNVGLSDHEACRGVEPVLREAADMVRGLAGERVWSAHTAGVLNRSAGRLEAFCDTVGLASAACIPPLARDAGGSNPFRRKRDRGAAREGGALSLADVAARYGLEDAAILAGHQGHATLYSLSQDVLRTDPEAPYLALIHAIETAGGEGVWLPEFDDAEAVMAEMTDSARLVGFQARAKNAQRNATCRPAAAASLLTLTAHGLGRVVIPGNPVFGSVLACLSSRAPRLLGWVDGINRASGDAGHTLVDRDGALYAHWAPFATECSYMLPRPPDQRLVPASDDTLVHCAVAGACSTVLRMAARTDRTVSLWGREAQTVAHYLDEIDAAVHLAHMVEARFYPYEIEADFALGYSMGETRVARVLGETG